MTEGVLEATEKTTQTQQKKKQEYFWVYNSFQVPQHDPNEPPWKRPVTIEEKQAVVCQYAKLVLKIAQRVFKLPHARRWGTLGDFFQEGIKSIYNCMELYDPNRSTAVFRTYLYTAVYRALLTKVQESAGIIKTPRSGPWSWRMDEDLSKLSPEEKERLANEKELDDKFDQALALAYKRARSVASIDARRDKNSAATFPGKDTSLLEMLEARKGLTEREWDDSLEEVRKALRTLSERHAEVLKRRLGIEPGTEEETLREIGESWHVSKERARQVEAVALSKLRNWLMEKDPEEYETQVARSKMFTTQLKPHPIDAQAAIVAPGDSSEQEN